jgi:carboxyl-terminal processing protease
MIINNIRVTWRGSHCSLLLAVGIALTLCSWSAAAPAPAREGDTLHESHLSQLMAGCLKLHISRNELTPEIAAATLSNVVLMLDPSKTTFTKQDVDGIYALRVVFPQAYRQSNWGFVTGVYALFLQRVAEQNSNALAYLSSPWTRLEREREIIIDPKKRDFATTPAEMQTNLEDALQYALAYLVASGESFTGAVAKVTRRRARLYKVYEEFTHAERLGLFMNAFCTALDPHTAYFNPDDSDEFEINMSLSLEGIGAVLSQDDGVTEIKSLTPGGPAQRSGQVRAGDKIMYVAQGATNAFEDIYDVQLKDVVKKIRGKKGTQVRLKLTRMTANGPLNLEVSLIRDKVNLADMTPAMEILPATRTNENGAVHLYRIAVIDVPSFYFDRDTRQMFGKYERSTVADVRRLLSACATSDIAGVVVNLQRNGGGSLDEAVDAAGLFMARPNVVISRDIRNPRTILRDSDAGISYAGPVIVAVSRATASGAEIVAGSLHEYQRALLIGGDHTFGKGTIQQVLPLPGRLGSLKITVGEYFLASGRSPQHSGVTPDIVLPSEYSALELGERYQPNALPARSVDSAISSAARTGKGPQGWQPVRDDVIARLAHMSQLRVANLDRFKKVEENIERLTRERAKTNIMIATLLATVTSNTPTVDSITEMSEDADSLRSSATNDAVLLEAVDIMADWLALEAGAFDGYAAPTNIGAAAGGSYPAPVPDNAASDRQQEATATERSALARCLDWLRSLWSDTP